MRPSTASRQDSGFTVAELAVAMIVGLIVLGVVYFIFESALGAIRRVDEDTVASRHASESIHVTSKFAREMTVIERAANNTIRIQTDRNDDGVEERVTYALDGSGNFTEAVTNMTSGATTTTILARNVKNASLGEPVFRYFKAINTEAVPAGTGEGGERLNLTKILRITLITDVSDQAPAPFRVTTDVTLRNSLPQ